MKRSTKYIIAGVAVVIAVGGVFAARQMRGQFREEHARMRMEMFSRTDANSDQAISLDEMMAEIGRRFDAADANSDATLSKDELIKAIESDPAHPRAKRWSGRIADSMMSRFDLDEDGKVARGEIDGRARKLFALLDRDDNGQVAMAELQRDMAGRGRGRGGRHGWWGRDDD
ncbi:MAG: hypothetical protein WBO55_11620 [Rhizobiaceae bacterium]